MLPQELHHVAGKVPEVALSEQAQHGTYAIALSPYESCRLFTQTGRA